MGRIQTAIGRLLGTVSGAALAGLKVYQHEGQIKTQKAEELAKNAAQEAEEQKEAQAVATEADVQNLGASEIEAKAYRLAQERGLADPKRIIYDEAGKPLATYEEMASLLSDENLTGTLTSQLRTQDAIKARKNLLEGKTHKERVENARLSVGGGKK